MQNLTIGMATYDDHPGVWATIQALRMYHGAPGRECEIVVVDNNPGGSHAEQNRKLCKWVSDAGQPCRYIPFDEVTGTSTPRDRVFKEAAGEFVVCMDSHILLWPGAVESLVAWFDGNRDSKDLVTGPMMYDGLVTFSTHFDDVWRDKMWGILAAAWQCECGFQFSPALAANDSKVAFLNLVPPQSRAAACACGKPWPTLAWSGHEHELVRLGYKRLGGLVADSPFEIPALGLGVFGCRKDAWLGFNEKFRGFGGEEWYIHEKYRKAGYKCLSLPFLRWVHRFGRPDGVPYPLALWHRVRNYVIGHHELGLPLDRIREHFPESVMPYQEWVQLANNPGNPPEWPTGPQVQAAPANCNGCGEQPPASAKLDPIGVNTPHLAKYTSQAEHVTDSRLTRGVRNMGTDLLFIGNCKSQPQLSTELVVHHLKSKRWLAIHGADHPGIIAAIANFLHHEKAWFVVDRWPGDGGLIVLSRDERDRPDEPFHITDPGYGPGTELKAILQSIGIVPPPTCDCESKARIMNMMGPKQVMANIDALAAQLREGAANRWGWMDKLKAAALAVANGIAFKINWADPFPGLIEEACRRAAEKDEARKVQRAA